jgi:hypothetical protein
MRWREHTSGKNKAPKRKRPEDDVPSSGDVPFEWDDAKPLAITPRPHSRESLLPYALRLAEENGYPTLTYFMKRQDEINFLASRRMEVDRLARSANLSEDQSQRLAYVTDASKKLRLASLVGQLVGEYELRIRSPQVCPDCIDENGFIEAAWDLAWITCCPIHRRRLVDVCATCGLGLSWNRPAMAKCKRGHDLTSAHAVPASDAEVDLAAFFMDKLYAGDDSWRPFRAPDDVWSGASLLDACRVATGLAQRISSHDRSKRRWVRGRSELFALNKVPSLHALFCGLAADRRELYERVMIDPRTGTKNRSFHRAFAWMLGKIEKTRASIVIAPVLDELFDFAAQHWPASRLDRTSVAFRGFLTESRCLSIVRAAAELDVSTNLISKGVKTGLIPHERFSGVSNHGVIIPRSWVEGQQRISRDSYSEAQVRRMLGFGGRLAEAIQKEGLIEGCIFSSRSTTLKHDIDLIVGMLHKNILLKESTPQPVPDGGVTFREMMKSREDSDRIKLDLVKMMLRGDVRAIKKDSAKDIGDVVFDDQEIKQVIDGMRRDVKTEMKVKEARKLLGVGRLDPLVKCGHLKQLRSLRSARFICAKSVFAFHRDYIYAPHILDKSSNVAKLLKVSRFVGGLRLLEVPTGSRNASMWFVRRELISFVNVALTCLGNVEVPRPNSPKEQAIFTDAMRLTLTRMRCLPN